MSGRWVFAATLIGLGIIGLITGHFTPTWSGVPSGLPGRAALAYVCALVALGCGAGLLWHRSAAVASRVLLAYFVLWFLVFRVPLVFEAAASSGTWWACGATAVMAAAAWVLYARFTAGFASGDEGVRIARVLYGLGMIPFGVAHFTFLERTVSLVPAWLPWHLAWAYLTGCAFIAAGLAVLIGVSARLAATLSIIRSPLVASSPATRDSTAYSDCVFRSSPWICRQPPTSACSRTCMTWW